MFLLLVQIIVSGQEKEFEPYGKVFANVYTNFHRGIMGNAVNESAFELERGYIGYEYPSSWFQIVDFKGAFGEDNWIEGWTLLTKEPN